MKRWLVLLLLAGGVGAVSSAAAQSAGVAPDLPRAEFFGQEDADADGRITRDEARAAALAWFARFDADRDGQVTAAEARAGAQRWRRERRAARFAARDRDHDGSVSARELGATPRRFAWLDRDADGRLTPTELAREGEASRCSGGEEAALRSAVWRRDLDRDGRVTRQEALRAADLRFARKDHDRDGVLTHEPAPRRSRSGERARARTHRPRP